MYESPTKNIKGAGVTTRVSDNEGIAVSNLCYNNDCVKAPTRNREYTGTRRQGRAGERHGLATPRGKKGGPTALCVRLRLQNAGDRGW